MLKPLRPTLVVNPDKAFRPKQTDDTNQGGNKLFGASNQFFMTNKEVHAKKRGTLTPAGTSIRREGRADGPGNEALYERDYTRRERCWKCCCNCCCFPCMRCRKRSRKYYTSDASRPMYRDDIFFNGSLVMLPQYRESERKLERRQSAIDYHLTVSRAATARDVDDYCCSCCFDGPICSDAFCRTLATMLDFHLLKSLSYILVCISCTLTAMGQYAVYVFIIDRGVEYGMDNDAAVLLLSTVGISNAIGRLGSSILTTIPNIKALMVTYLSLCLCGVATMISPFFRLAWQQFTYAAIFGTTIACISSLRTIVVVDLFGLDKLSNAFGLLLMFAGVGSLFGTPIIGKMVDTYKSYDEGFILAGAFILASSLILLPVKRIAKWEKNHA